MDVDPVIISMTMPAKSRSEKVLVISAPLSGEPGAVWKRAPRYAPHVEFPPYRHVPGASPHPVRHEEGHSHGLSHSRNAEVTADNWRQNRAYLFGIDLYHQGYLWESHEAWEGAWRDVEPDRLEANLLQALILNSAALLKVHLGNSAGARKHSQAARWRLARIRAKGYDSAAMRFLGIDIADLIEQMKRYYGPLWESGDAKEIRVKGKPPRIVLDIADA